MSVFVNKVFIASTMQLPQFNLCLNAGTIPSSSALIDCQGVNCRNQQLTCLPEEDCSVHCYDSRQYACIASRVDCPSITGDCTVNCDDPYSCLQASSTCPQGNCNTSCKADYSCQYFDHQCSGDNCLLDCDGIEACQNSVVGCSSDHCELKCDSEDNSNACNSITYNCSGDDCILDCPGHGSCQNSIINAASTNSFYWHCWKACHNSMLTCTSKTCHVNCEHYFGCNQINFQYGASESFTLECRDFGAGFTCRGFHILPLYLADSSPGNLTVRCYGNHVCTGKTLIDCPSGDSCFIHCTGPGSCANFKNTCPSGGDCEVLYDGSSSGGVAYGATTTCEENSKCNIICTGSDPNRPDVCRTSTFDCSSDSAQCNIECDSYFTCREATITCGTNGNCVTCSGYQSCYQSSITLTGETASLNCSGPNHACSSSTITCTDNNDCTVHCTNSYSCSQSTRINCPENGDCTIDCSGENSCDSARITCPTGDYSCDVLCTDPLSCASLSIMNTHNLYLQCCGGTACSGVGITPNSNACA